MAWKFNPYTSQLDYYLEYTAGEGIDITGDVITNTAHAPQDVTYTELKDLADTAALKPNGRYRLTDFRTYQLIPWTTPAEYVTGPTEVLLLVANSATELSSVAVSESYPKDIIYYELVCTHSFEGLHTPLCGGDRGWIYYREDTTQKNKFNYDFRACKWRRWYDPITDTYTIYNDNAEAYQDVYTFADYSRAHNNDFGWGDSPDAPVNRSSYNNVFYNTGTEVYANTGSVEFQNNTFGGRCYENRFGVRTSYNRFMSGVRYNNLKDNFNFAFIGGNFDANETNMDCSTWTITGNCVGNRVGRSAYELNVTGNFNYNVLTHNCMYLTFDDNVTGLKIVSELASYTFASEINNITIGGDVPWDVSYDELFTMYDNGTLIPGQKYRITDFETVYTIPNTADTRIAGAEPLIVTALNQYYSSQEAFSEGNPNDIIHYEIVCQHTWDGNPIDATKGWIYYRKDTANNNEAPFDLRGCVWRRWETSVGSGVYTEITDPGNGEAYQDLVTFASGKNNVIAEGGFNIVMGNDYNYNRILLPNSKNLTLANSTSNYLLDLIVGGTSDLVQATLQIRRDTYSNWTNNNPILVEGEIGIAIDQSPVICWVGDGSTDIAGLTARRWISEAEWGIGRSGTGWIREAQRPEP